MAGRIISLDKMMQNNSKLFVYYISILCKKEMTGIHVEAMTEKMRVMASEMYENKGWIRTCKLDQVWNILFYLMLKRSYLGMKFSVKNIHEVITSGKKRPKYGFCCPLSTPFIWLCGAQVLLRRWAAECMWELEALWGSGSKCHGASPTVEFPKRHLKMLVLNPVYPVSMCEIIEGKIKISLI